MTELRAQLAREGKLALSFKVQPKSPRTEWAGRLEDGTWKVRLAAVAEKGRANAELISFLARELGVARSQVEIVAGATSRVKQVRVAL